MIFRAHQGGKNSGGTAEDGYIHCGPSGSGHFVKMVHNGIEYGIMQAYAEGFDIFKNATSKELPEDIRYDSESAGHRGSMAARQRGQFVAARSDGDGADGKSDTVRIRRDSCRIPARAAGRFRRRSTRPCRWTC